MKYLITGGAGFIGINFAKKIMDTAEGGSAIMIFDDFSKPGSRENYFWLSKEYPTFRYSIVNDIDKLYEECDDADVVFHLAAQTAVTKSVENPVFDFYANALGTLNVLEAIRRSKKQPILIYSSTNKVYGELKFKNTPVDESYPLDFYSPYGCSKGCGDSYVLDYARIYGLKTVVFRQSCIYGERQFGTEDQGWLAWFIIAALTGKKITIYGDGNQRRDVLHVDDLFDAFMSAVKNIDIVKGKVFNIGGGPENVLSLHDLCNYLENKLRYPLRCEYAKKRPGDQDYYCSDITYAEHLLWWKPKIGKNEGIEKLWNWVLKHLELFNL